MVAATGFQRSGYQKCELVTMFRNILKSGDKYMEYTRKSLRGAKDIYLQGGHVTAILKDQIFRMFHDNRRYFNENVSLLNNA